ncbi:GDSL-type esterase/lipase family protein [Lunatibacter salilacus]|uniref:GDSL-type esterase/lipase family protein n=1 Tax=Lunatibacter salilacus TaxID=2483804 RepID=UPI001F373279|nr:GDSL-type esterase/lipase family protein [Lunatibacter salilacus]
MIRFLQLICIFSIFLPYTTHAQVRDDLPFELKNGDRVVFLGNALMENEQVYNYLEFRLTRHWPERNITFRNLGWSGDNVFGEARSYYTSPPSAYDLLISQLTDSKATHVLVAYGSVEAQEGEGGLEKFAQGLEKLLAKIQELGAEAILLSPIPQFAGGTPSLLEERNSNLKLYAKTIAKIAQEKQKRYIDLISPFEKLAESELISENGLHLTEYGYYKLAEFVENSLGLDTEPWMISVDAKSGEIESSLITNMVISDPKNKRLEFTVDEKILPVAIPNSLNRESERPIAIKGLKKGFYSLEINGKLVASASAKAWAEGVSLKQGGTLDQADHLKRLLNKKDEVFFYQYRPLNRTYIIGFREYEQGRHASDLRDYDVVLTWLQGQITATKSPIRTHYKLYPTP